MVGDECTDVFSLLRVFIREYGSPRFGCSIFGIESSIIEEGLAKFRHEINFTRPVRFFTFNASIVYDPEMGPIALLLLPDLMSQVQDNFRFVGLRERVSVKSNTRCSSELYFNVPIFQKDRVITRCGRFSGVAEPGAVSCIGILRGTGYNMQLVTRDGH